MANVNVKSMDIGHRCLPFVEIPARVGTSLRTMDYSLRANPFASNVIYDLATQTIGGKANIVYMVPQTTEAQARVKRTLENIYAQDKGMGAQILSQWSLGTTTYPHGGTFVASKNSLARLDIGICKNGYNDLTATITLKIWATSSHVPTGNPLYTRVLQPSEIQQYMWYNAYRTFALQPFYIDDPIPLTIGSEYAWTMEVSADETHHYVFNAGVPTGSSGNYRVTKVGGTWYAYTTSVIPFTAFAANRIVSKARIKSTPTIGWTRQITTPYSGGGWLMGGLYQCGGTWVANSDKIRMVRACWYKGANTTAKSYCDIYLADANHKPTGASLGQAVLQESNVVTGYGKYTDFIFSVDVSLTIGLEYCFVIKSPWSRTSGGENFNIEIAANKGTSEGSLYSTDGGATWAYNTTGSQIWVFEILTQESNIQISAQGRIFGTPEQTASAKANIFNTVEQTVTGKAKIILAAATKTIEGKARVLNTMQKTSQAKAKVVNMVEQTSSAKARVLKMAPQTVQAKADIKKMTERTATAKARVANTMEKTTSAKARVKVLSQEKTTSAKARVKKVDNNKTASGKARIKKGAESSVSARAYIKVSQQTTAQSKARIKGTPEKTVSVKADIKKFGINQTAGAKAKIANVITQTSQSKARIFNTLTKTSQAKVRVKKVNNNKTTSAKANIKNMTPRTVNARAIISKLQEPTISAYADIKNVVNRTAPA